MVAPAVTLAILLATSPSLEEGRAQFAALRYVQAIQKLAPLTRDEAAPKAERLEALDLTARAQLALNQPAKAQAAYDALLALEPMAEQPKAAPKVVAAFRKAKQARFPPTYARLERRKTADDVLDVEVVNPWRLPLHLELFDDAAPSAPPRVLPVEGARALASLAPGSRAWLRAVTADGVVLATLGSPAQPLLGPAALAVAPAPGAAGPDASGSAARGAGGAAPAPGGPPAGSAPEASAAPAGTALATAAGRAPGASTGSAPEASAAPAGGATATSPAPAGGAQPPAAGATGWGAPPTRPADAPLARSTAPRLGPAGPVPLADMPTSTRRALGWSGLGLGFALFAVGAGLLISAIVDWSTGMGWPLTVSWEEKLALDQSSQTKAIIGLPLAAVGALGLLGGGYLLVSEPAAPRQQPLTER